MEDNVTKRHLEKLSTTFWAREFDDTKMDHLTIGDLQRLG
jgi:hypothetical protein